MTGNNSIGAEKRPLPVPATPARRSTPPPPPPPPPPPSQRKHIPRRDLILGVAVVGATALGVTKGISSIRPKAQDERELAYVASQLGVPGTPSPVSAMIDKADGSVVAVVAIGETGRQYIATVDPKDGSQMVLVTDDGKGLFVLPTRFEQVDLANRRQIESIFRVAHWEDLLEEVR